MGGLVQRCIADFLGASAKAQKRKSKSFAQRRASVPVAGDEELSKSFKLTGDRLERMRQLGTMVIHNDEAGDVSDVDTRFFRIDPSKQNEVIALASLEEQKATLLGEHPPSSKEP